MVHVLLLLPATALLSSWHRRRPWPAAAGHDSVPLMPTTSSTCSYPVRPFILVLHTICCHFLIFLFIGCLWNACVVHWMLKVELLDFTSAPGISFDSHVQTFWWILTCTWDYTCLSRSRHHLGLYLHFSWIELVIELNDLLAQTMVRRPQWRLGRREVVELDLVRSRVLWSLITWDVMMLLPSFELFHLTFTTKFVELYHLAYWCNDLVFDFWLVLW